MPKELDRQGLVELLPWIVPDDQLPRRRPLASAVSEPIKATDAASLLLNGKFEERPNITSFWIYYIPNKSLDVLGLIGMSGTAKSLPEQSVIPKKEKLAPEYQSLPNITLEITSDSLSVNIHFREDTLPVDAYELEVGKSIDNPIHELPRDIRDGAFFANTRINSGKYLVLATGNIPFAAITYESQTVIAGKPSVTSVIMLLSNRLFRGNEYRNVKVNTSMMQF